MSVNTKMTEKITVLRVGEGEVRVRIDFGYSKEVLDGVWIKPGFSLEVPVPEDTPIDEYIEKEMLPYVKQKFKDRIKDVKRAAGVLRKSGTNGR